MTNCDLFYLMAKGYTIQMLFHPEKIIHLNIVNKLIRLLKKMWKTSKRFRKENYLKTLTIILIRIVIRMLFNDVKQ